MHINRRFARMCFDIYIQLWIRSNTVLWCIVMSRIKFQTTNLGPDFIIDLLSENDAARSPEMTG